MRLYTCTSPLISVLLAGSTGASPQLMYKPTGHLAQANLSVVPDDYAAEREF